MREEHKEYIYIVVSRTNTLLGKVIRKKLGVSYNHCSLSLDDSLELQENVRINTFVLNSLQKY